MGCFLRDNRRNCGADVRLASAAEIVIVEGVATFYELYPVTKLQFQLRFPTKKLLAFS